MKIKAYTPVLVGLAAIAGAVLRGLNLIYGYEVGTRLPARGDIPGIALIVLSIVSAILLIGAAAFFHENRGIVFEDAFWGAGTLFKMVSVIAGLAMLVCGAAGLYLAVTDSEVPITGNITALPLWLLAMLTGGCFIGAASALSRRAITAATATLLIVPMFWACFDLITTFKDNGASPFIGLYGFELLAAIALTYAFYSLAGFLYSTSSPSRFVISAGLAIIWCIAVAAGAGISIAAGAQAIVFPPQTLLRYACFFASGLWLFALMVLLARGTTRRIPQATMEY